MSRYDWIIRNGRVLDPANDVDGAFDVGIAGGRVAAVEERIDPSLGSKVFDASGKLVTPGLIDLHAHTYNHVTPLGINADYYCLGRGVTTAVDTGSAGSDTFPGFRVYSVEASRTRVLAFLNISRAGLSFSAAAGVEGGGELESLKIVNVDPCVDTIESNRDILVGVKIRLSESLADDGRNEPEAFRRAKEAAAAVGLPLMVHYSFTTVPHEDCPGSLAAGDIFTHCFHGYPGSIVDPETRRPAELIRAARDRGVRFDIGHGGGSFSWTVAEICVGEGFWPDTISTDIHTLTCNGPGYDMPTVMTKLLRVGMPLEEVIKGSTVDAARAIGWEDRIGTLGVGREADVAVLALEDVDVELEDCHVQMRRVRQRLVADAVWRAGEPGEITRPDPWPNPELPETLRAWRSHMVVKDA